MKVFMKVTVCSDEPWNWISMRVLLLPLPIKTMQELCYNLHQFQFESYDGTFLKNNFQKDTIFRFFPQNGTERRSLVSQCSKKLLILQHVYTRERYLSCSRFCWTQHLFLFNHTHTLATCFTPWETHFLPISHTKWCQRAAIFCRTRIKTKYKKQK